MIKSKISTENAGKYVSCEFRDVMITLKVRTLHPNELKKI